jgi:hypothetical protein
MSKIEIEIEIDIRNEFEGWAPASLDCSRWQNGKYFSPVTELCFEAYKLGLASNLKLT